MECGGLGFGLEPKYRIDPFEGEYFGIDRIRHPILLDMRDRICVKRNCHKEKWLMEIVKSEK